MVLYVIIINSAKFSENGHASSNLSQVISTYSNIQFNFSICSKLQNPSQDSLQVTEYMHHQSDRYDADAVGPKNNLTE